MRRVTLICLGLALLTLALYWPVQGYEFVDYDDQVYVTQNPYVTRGLSWEGVKHAFTGNVLDYWQPLTLLSHSLDCQLFGVNASAHHLVNVFFHLFNTVLLFLLLRRLTKAEWPSAAVAALFAWHPLHVESVAWIAERKDVLSTFWWCLAVWCYLNYVSSRQRAPYALALVCFGLGLLAKSMVVTLPCVLLLLDYWPLQRCTLPAPADWAKERDAWLKTLRSLVLEKVPFFALSGALSWLTFHMQKAGGSFISAESLPLYLRVGNAFVSYARYLGKTFWPEALVAFYPHPGVWPVWKVAGSILLFAAITVLAVRQLRSRPWLAVGWFWFVGALVPAIGLVQAGWQSIADHFTYLPLTGVFIMLVWGAAEIIERRQIPRNAVIALSVVVLGACAVTARLQMAHWRNSYELFAHAANVTSKNAVAEMGLGNALMRAGKTADALQHLQAAVDIYPKFTDALRNLANAQVAAGLAQEAKSNYEKALKYTPSDPESHLGLATILLNEGKLDEAVQHYRATLAKRPDSSLTHYNLASALVRQGKWDEAKKEFETALQSQPDLAEAHLGLATIYERSGNFAEAEKHYQAALASQPDNANAHGGYGLMLARGGRTAEAAEQLFLWAKLKPEDPQPPYWLGVTFLTGGRTAEALVAFQRSMQLNPNRVEPTYLAARILCTSPDNALRNGDEALKLAERANQLSQGRNPMVLDTLAAAYAEKGRFTDAITTQEKAIAAAQAAGQKPLADSMQPRLQLYREGKPYRETGQ